MVFQPEVYVIKACADENIKQCYGKRNIYILCNSHASFKVLDICKISSRLVWDSYQSLMILAEYNKVHLLWLPQHKGTDGNKTADQAVRKKHLKPFSGTEPTCGISGRAAGHVIMDCVCREQQNYWQSISGQKHAKSFLITSCDKITAEFLKLSRLHAR
jgi:hypothetical protein